MKLDFLKNISILLITNILVRPFYIFGIDLKIQNLLGPQEYGLYFIVFDFVYLFLFINDPGLQTYSSKTIAASKENSDKQLGNILSTKIILSVLYILISIIAAKIMGFDERRVYLVVMVSLGLALSSIFVLLRSFFSGLGYYTYDSYLSSLDRLIMIVLIGSIVYGIAGDMHSIEQMVLFQNLSYGLAIGVVLILIFNKVKSLKITLNLSESFSILRAGVPFAALIMLTALCNKIDVVMLDFLRSDGEYQSGIYAAGYRFLDASNMFGYLFGALLLPMYSQMYANKKDVKDLFNTAFQMLIILSLPLTLVSCFFGKEIFELFYTQDYINHSNVFMALMLSLLPIMVSHSIGSLLIAFGKLNWLNIIFLIAVIINIILNYFIIPKYGALGSAYTTFISEIFLIISTLLVVIKVCEVPIRREIAIKSTLILIFSLAILFILSSILTINWLIKVLLFLSTYVLLIIKLKIITIPSIRVLIKK